MYIYIIYIYVCIYESMYLCIYVSLYLCIYVSMYLCMYVYIYLSIYLSIHPSIHPSIHLSIHLSIPLSLPLVAEPHSYPMKVPKSESPASIASPRALGTKAPLATARNLPTAHGGILPCHVFGAMDGQGTPFVQGK